MSETPEPVLIVHAGVAGAHGGAISTGPEPEQDEEAGTE